MITDGGDEPHGFLITRASLDDLAEDRHHDFAGNSEDRCVLAVSKSESGDLRRGPRSDFAVGGEHLCNMALKLLNQIPDRWRLAYLGHMER